VNVIETVDIELAAYAMARGGGLRVIDRAAGPLFRVEGPGIEEVEIDFVHFGPLGVRRDRLEQLTGLLATLYGGRWS
jgi:hypothetical protein